MSGTFAPPTKVGVALALASRMVAASLACLLVPALHPAPIQLVYLQMYCWQSPKTHGNSLASTDSLCSTCSSVLSRLAVLDVMDKLVYMFAGGVWTAL